MHCLRIFNVSINKIKILLSIVFELHFAISIGHLPSATVFSLESDSLIVLIRKECYSAIYPSLLLYFKLLSITTIKNYLIAQSQSNVQLTTEIINSRSFKSGIFAENLYRVIKHTEQQVLSVKSQW